MKHLSLIFFLALALFGASRTAWSRDVIISNVVVQPTTAANGSDITVSFDIVAAAGGGGDNRYFSVGLAAAGYTYSCSTTNQINWVADELGIYSNALGYQVNGVTTALPSRAITDVVGPSTGLLAGAGTTPARVTMTVKVPPEFSGNYTVVVIGGRDGMSVQSSTCGSCVTGSSHGYGNFTVTGTPVVKMDLMACRTGGVGACTPGALCWQYKIMNWGEAGVRVTNFDIKFCFFDSQSCWEAQASSNVYTKLPGGGWYCNVYNPADQFSFEEFSTVDCGSDGKANHCYHYTLTGGAISQSMPYFVPPGGGFIESNSPPIFLRPCGWSGTSTNDPADDYAAFMNWPVCTGPPSTVWTSTPKIALFYGGVPLCEWDSNATNDPSSGVPHCGSGSGCNACPPGYMSNTARNATGASNTICVPIYSPTPTPQMQLTKTADRAQASLGDTITFTIAWTNDSSAARTMVIWDTVPANLTYVGCAYSVGTSCSSSGGLVTWNLGSRPAGASGTVTFWATVSSYPWLPDLLDKRVALAPKAPKTRELLLGLWTRQATARR